MAEEVTMELMHEILKRIHASQERVENDIRDVKFRITQVEETMLHHTKQFDNMSESIARIETRLDLVDA